MTVDIPSDALAALHRIDALTPPAQAQPTCTPGDIRPSVQSRRPILAVAAVLVLAAAVVATVARRPEPASAARFPVVNVPSGPPAILPTPLPTGFVLTNGTRLGADPADRGPIVVTGRLDGTTVRDWRSAWASPEGLRAAFTAGTAERVTTSRRTYDLGQLDGAIVADFDGGACGRVNVLTADGGREAALAAGDAVSCRDDGMLAAVAPAGSIVLYAGPRNSAPDDGVVLRYHGPGDTTVSVHLRRVGFPIELSGISFGEQSQTVLGGKQVQRFDDGQRRTVTWSPAEGESVVITAPSDLSEADLERFVAALGPVSATAMGEACREAIGTDCN